MTIPDEKLATEKITVRHRFRYFHSAILVALSLQGILFLIKAVVDATITHSHFAGPYLVYASIFLLYPIFHLVKLMTWDRAKVLTEE